MASLNLIVTHVRLVVHIVTPRLKAEGCGSEGFLRDVRACDWPVGSLHWLRAPRVQPPPEAGAIVEADAIVEPPPLHHARRESQFGYL